MRMIVAIVISLTFVALLPRASLAEEVVASRAEIAIPPELVSETVPESTMSLSAQEIVFGTVAVGGAFAVGLIAGGSLAAGIVAVSVLAIGYSVLP